MEKPLKLRKIQHDILNHVRRGCRSISEIDLWVRAGSPISYSRRFIRMETLDLIDLGLIERVKDSVSAANRRWCSNKSEKLARAGWDAATVRADAILRADSTTVPVVAEFVAHEHALREHEADKLNRLEILIFAQRTRTKFLGLSIPDRKIFLDVLTSDDGGSMTRLFELQNQVEAEHLTEDVALNKAVQKNKRN